MCDEVDEAGEPIKVEDAKKILDLFDWNNFEHMELKFWACEDNNIPHERLQISNYITYRVFNRRGITPSREDLDFKIAKYEYFVLLEIIIHFKHTKKCINLNLETHILKLSGGLCIIMEQIKEKIGFPLRRLIIE